MYGHALAGYVQDLSLTPSSDADMPSEAAHENEPRLACLAVTVGGDLLNTKLN